MNTSSFKDKVKAALLAILVTVIFLVAAFFGGPSNIYS